MKTLRNLFAAALTTAAILLTVGCPRPNDPAPEDPVEPVTFSPTDGTSINPGSTVRLSTATSDAEIYYVIDTEVTDANAQSMLESMTNSAQNAVDVTVDKACTIYAVAVRGSTGKMSSVTKASYTMNVVPAPVAFDPAAGTVKSGTKVKLSATPAEGETTVKIWFSTAAALTAENYSTAGTEYDATAENPGVEITGNTTIYAIAVGESGKAGNPSSAAYTLSPTLMTAAPEADDVVYIYYPTEKNVMLSTANGSELNSATVTIDDALGGFATTETMAALTVFKNEIGQYVFVSGGKYLTTTGRNNLTLSDTFTVFALWEVEAISEGSSTFYIHSVNSIYNNTRQGLEYYNSKFSAYDRRTQAIYQFQFYKDPNKTSELDEQAKAALALQANSLATPTFSISSTAEGQFITPGLVTYLSSDSLDVEFYYTTDGSEITRENYATKASANPATAFKYVASQGILITGDQNDTVTINAIAVKTVPDGERTRGIFSLPASAVYTLGVDTNTYLQKVAALADNDVVAIYYPKEHTTISSTTSGSGFSGTAATVSTKGLVLSDSLTQFTVKKLNTDGYVFVNGGKYLSRSDSNGLVLADAFTENSVWNLENAGSSADSFYIKNVGDSTRYIEFYNVFTVYTFQASNTPIYTFQFYKNESGRVEQITLPLLRVNFSVPSGTVTTNTPITLTSRNGEGTEIYWMWRKDGILNNTNYSSAPATKYGNTNKPTVTENGTLQAIAVKNGQTSDVATVEYTVLAGGQTQETLSIANASSVVDKKSGNELLGTTHSGTRNDSAQNIRVNFSTAQSTVDFSKPGSSGTNPAYYKTGNEVPPVHIRLYGSNTLTITATDTSKTIVAITITKTEGSSDDQKKWSNISADSGTVTNGNTNTQPVKWTGSANSVVFTNTTRGGHARISEITIIYAE